MRVVLSLKERAPYASLNGSILLALVFSIWPAWSYAQSDCSSVAAGGLYTYRANITSVYDGDTVTASVDLGFKVWLYGIKIRLFGINAPEMRGEERPEGIKSRDYLRALIKDSDVILRTVKDRKGKYGRYLADIYVDSSIGCIWVNSHLVEQGLAEYRQY